MVMKKSRAEFSQMVKVERSKSRTGKHKHVRLAFIMDHNAKVVERIEPREDSSEKLYKVGTAEIREVKYSPSQVLVILDLTVNSRGKVEGYAEVYDRGEPVYRAVYRKLKLRGSKGDPTYSIFVENLFKHLKLKVKRVNPDAHLGRRRGDEGDKAQRNG